MLNRISVKYLPRIIGRATLARPFSVEVNQHVLLQVFAKLPIN